LIHFYKRLASHWDKAVPADGGDGGGKPGQPGR